MAIYTVLGPIEPSELGPTSMHEHVQSDARALLTTPREPIPDDRRVTIANLGFVRWNLLALEDNLLLDDPRLAERELEGVTAAGGSGVVDLTVVGLGQQVEQLPRIARATGLHLMTGCGFYIGKTHPDWIAALSVDALREHLSRELSEGFGDTGVMPALVGLIGTSDPITAGEERVLLAAAGAAAQAGAAMNVRLDPSARHAHRVLDLAEQEALPPARVIFGNVDEYLDPPYHREVADRGAVLEFCFGSEFYYRRGYKDPTDAERFEHLVPLLAEGYSDRIVLGCSVWTKAQLRAFGGFGYDHVLRRIVPELKDSYGVAETEVERMLVGNPRRLLDRQPARSEQGGRT
jgi:phosphotriesterase-related protein